MPVCLELETPRAAERHRDGSSRAADAGETDSKAEPPSLQTRGGRRAGRQRVILQSRRSPRFRLYQRGRARRLLVRTVNGEDVFLRSRLRVDFLRLHGDDVALDDASVFVGRRLRDDDGWRVEPVSYTHLTLPTKA